MLDLLEEHLVGKGEVPSAELKLLAMERGIAVRSLQLCARHLGVEMRNVGFPRTTVWVLDELPPPPPKLKILALGAGVQSTTLALMACEGLIHIDHAIYSDTGWEPKKVYRHLDRLEEKMTEHGIPVHRVGTADLRENAMDPGRHFVSMPLHTLRNGKPGLMKRQCTSQYKIRPILKKVRDLACIPGTRTLIPGIRVDQMIGFSTDEIFRVNDRKDNWYTTRIFPLIEMGMSRDDCKEWLASRGWGETPRSSCVGCPFHSNVEWRAIREDPDDWASAVEFDRHIRKGSSKTKPLEGEAFLHFSRVPLELADLSKPSRKETAGCSPFACKGSIAGTI